MKSKWFSLVSILLVAIMLISACGATEEPAAEPTEAPAAEAEPTEAPAAEAEEVTLRVLVHQNPPLAEYMEQFNADFEAANPGVTVDLSTVTPGDMATVIQTRLSATDVDVIDYCAGSCSGFSNAVQPYMSGVDKPTWQQLIEANLLMDLTDEPFVQNFDEASIRDAGTFDGRVYAINVARVSYSGMFVNNDLLADVGVAIPTTWSELVSACETVVDSGLQCMTAGGGDGWPIFVGTYGLLGAVFPDQEGLVEGLWTGDTTWNEGKGLEVIEKDQVFAQEMLEPGVTSFSHDEAAVRYTAGDVAFLPTGVWQAPILEENAEFDWTYVPFPGSDDPADNQYLFGKYDMSWMIAADSPHADVAKAYLAALADPDNYQEFVDTTGYLPTQPTATLNSKLGQAVAPLLDTYQVGFEQYWVSPKGAGQWANGSQAASWFAPFNEWTDAKELADQIQADLEAGLAGE